MYHKHWKWLYTTIRSYLYYITIIAGIIILGNLKALGQTENIPGDDRPNILWISAEDLSPRLSSYGDKLARTPNLDRLAAEGVRYTRAFTTAGVCAPSRSAIITGMYQSGIGTHHMRTGSAPRPIGPYQAVPPTYVKAFTEYLRAAGYFTTNNKKTDYQFGEPFSVWDASSGEAHWHDRPNPEQPFFAVFNHVTTHEARLFGKEENTETDPSAVEVPPYYPDTYQVREELAHHYDQIAKLDQQVGQILDQLEENGLADETIVVFWGDHGDGLPRAKRWLYDSGIRVPLIVRVPEKYRNWAEIGAPGSTNGALVSLMDLGPTMLSLAGISIPEHMDGRAFLGPQASPEPDYIFGAHDRIDRYAYDMVRSARGKRYHYIRNFYPEKPYVLHVPFRNNTDTIRELFRLEATGGLDETERLWMRENRLPEELYDTKTDPHEVNNLAGDPQYADVLERMRRVTEQWMKEIGDLGLVTESQMVQRMWPDMEQPVTADPVIVQRGSTKGKSAPDTLSAPVKITIFSLTQGASVEYKTEKGGRWKLYSGPIHFAEPGRHQIWARAIRYGYKPSDTMEADFIVSSRENI